MMGRCGIFLSCSLGDKVSGPPGMRFHFAVQLAENRGLSKEEDKETPKG